MVFPPSRMTRYLYRLAIPTTATTAAVTMSHCSVGTLVKAAVASGEVATLGSVVQR